MSKSSETIESAAMQLSPEDRVRLAERLIASVEPDPEVEAAWASEVKRRVHDWEAGRVTEISWDDARRQIEERLRSR
jgi:putative addiction module component (TIGR02574 family)